METKDISLSIAFEYLRSKTKGATSFVSSLAYTCVAIGVAVLIIVSSVMNGFEKELRDRILNVIPHASIEGILPISDWNEIYMSLKEHQKVVGVAPFIQSQMLIGSLDEVYGSNLIGIDPDSEKSVSVVSSFIIKGNYESLNEDSNNIILGELLARKLNLDVGNQVSLMLPDNNASFSGYFPKIKNFKVSGIFRVGAPDIDEGVAYINISQAANLLSLKDKIHGFRIKFDDLFEANYLSWEVLMDVEDLTDQILISENWTFTYGPLFEAIMMEKTLVGLLVFLIVLVAAFNIVSMLVMMINDKKAQLAIFKTMGMSKYEIRKIFIYLGAMIASIGSLVGLILGLSLTFLLSSRIFEEFINSLMQGTYFISYFPIDVRFSWVFFILFSTIILTLLVCLYPARIASKVIPAEVLRNE
ncbi:MAG: lipoprotein-releasing ABC transporter permease subunit [Gammaproteobacteria bacterium]